jgi:hypothetical protein
MALKFKIRMSKSETIPKFKTTKSKTKLKKLF